MTGQIYEQYWKITLEYSDIHGEKFNRCLRMIINFIDSNRPTYYSNDLYQKLQKSIYRVFPKADMASTRKSINQFVKLGFINKGLLSYHKDTKSFLISDSPSKKETLFSRIVYSNSSFDRTVSNESEKREINFLIKTLAEVKKIDKEDLLALMTTDITAISKGFLNRMELDEARRFSEEIGLNSRKYNQKNHLWSVLKYLDNLIILGDTLVLDDDASEFEKISQKDDHKRDQYLQLLYKNQLKEESLEKTGKVQCMVEMIEYPSLIASHIKPFLVSDTSEEYDVNNGLLLGKDIDNLFDKGLITFNLDGNVVISSKLNESVAKKYSSLFINKRFLNEKRKQYLKYHLEKVFRGV